MHGIDDYALLTTARSRGVAGPLAEGARVVVDVPPGPVDEISAEIRAEVDGRDVVALGGGRVIDTGKALAGADGGRCAAIPTTLSGAELTRFHRTPRGAEDPVLVRPSLVVADPDLMASQPMPDLAASAMNALAHAVEALYTPMANPVASMAALRAADLISMALSRDEPARLEIALGALLAGYASGQTGYAVHHVVCQSTVRIAGTPHAQTNAVVLPHSVEFMAARAPAEIGALAGALGDGSDPAAAAGLVRSLVDKAQVTNLRDLGVRDEHVPQIVTAVSHRPEFRNTPGTPGEDDLRRLVESALG